MTNPRLTGRAGSPFYLAAFANERKRKAPYFVFEIYTSLVKKYLQINNSQLLKLYAVDATNKKYEFWQRDSLPFELLIKKLLTKSLITFPSERCQPGGPNNPNAEHWNLCKEPADYYYSSARFYETGIDDFGFLKHIGEVL